MKKYKLMVALTVATTLLLAVTGCGKSTETAKQEAEAREADENTETNSQQALEVISQVSYSATGNSQAGCKITLKGATAECDGVGAGFKDGILTIAQAGCYEISGELEDGRIVVDATENDKIQIILNGVDVTCSDYAPFVVLQADETIITLANGTTNTFTDGGNYYSADSSDDETPSAAFFSKDDLGFEGNGTLVVEASCNDGIAGKDDVWFINGNYEITASDDGVVGKDSIVVEGGTFAIEAGGDGMKSTEDTDAEKGFVSIKNGDLAITAADDGIHGETVVVITDGNILIEQSYEGIESESIIVKGGSIDLTSSDDGFNAANGDSAEGMDGPGGMGGQPGANSNSTGTLIIEGGKIYVNAGGDSLDANGSIYMSGGEVLVDGPTNSGNGILDYDGEFVVTGGRLTGAGSSGMLQATSSNSTQGGMALALGYSYEAGSEVVIKDESGNEILSFIPSKTFSAIVVSDPELKVGETYTIEIAGNALGTVTLSSVSVSNVSQGMGGQGGPGGNMGGGRKMR